MLQPILFLYIITFHVSQSTTTFLPLNEAHEKFHSNFHAQAQFGERIRDWYARVKESILERLQNPLERINDFFSLTKTQVQNKLANIGGLKLDLANVSFDLNKDWGFRIGRWYFIRKSDINFNSINPNFHDDWNAEDETELIDSDKNISTVSTKLPILTTASFISITTQIPTTAENTLTTFENVLPGDSLITVQTTTMSENLLTTMVPEILPAKTPNVEVSTIPEIEDRLMIQNETKEYSNNEHVTFDKQDQI